MGAVGGGRLCGLGWVLAHQLLYLVVVAKVSHKGVCLWRGLNSAFKRETLESTMIGRSKMGGGGGGTSMQSV